MMRLAFLLILVSGPAWGAAYNLRELCRERVAGIYLTLLDEVAISEPRLEMLKKKNQTLLKEQKVTATNLTKTKELLKTRSTDIPLRDKNEALESKQAAIVSSIEDNQKSIKEISLDLDSKRKAFKRMQSHLSPVFELIKISGKNPKGYPFRIEYGKPCARFQDGCGLSQADKQRLRALFQDQEMPEACQKYVNISEASE